MIRTLVVLATMLVASCWAARAHETASGKAYPWECCSGLDCKQVSARVVRSLPGGGWIVRTEDGDVSYSEKHRREPLDGEWHACWKPGTTDPLCIFPPDGGT